jgi:hypothetical protein
MNGNLQNRGSSVKFFQMKESFDTSSGRVIRSDLVIEPSWVMDQAEHSVEINKTLELIALLAGSSGTVFERLHSGVRLMI